MKNYILILLSGLFYMTITAQSNLPSEVAQYVPSPEVMSYRQYGDITTDLTRGLPEIGVPIYTLTEGSLKLPIGLRYNGGGIKVHEYPGRYGSSWSLNYGGMLSREIRGKADESGSGYYYYTGSATSSDLDGPDILSYVSGQRDSEPDLFTVTIGSQAVEFILVPNSSDVVLLSDSDLKIQSTIIGASIDGFTVTTATGEIYKFGGSYREYIQTGDATGSISSWFLAEITSFDGIDKITFEYEASTLSYDNPSYNVELIYKYCSSSPEVNGPINYVFDSYYLTQRLKKIRSKVATLTFDTAGSRVNFIKVEDSNKCFRHYLTYSASSGSRPLLSSIQKIMCSGATSIEAPYTFVYKDGVIHDRLSFSADHWGYYNGHNYTGNGLDIPVTVGELHTRGSSSVSRESDEAKMLIGSMESMTYPTGGKSDFEWEANRALKESIVKVDRQEFSVMLPSGSCSGSNEVVFYATADQIRAYEAEIALVPKISCYGDDPPNYEGVLTVYRQDDAGLFQVLGSTGFNNYSDQVSIKFEDFINMDQIESGTFKVSLSTDNCQGHVQLVENELQEILEIVGGLRIKRILHNDGFGHQIIKSYDYQESGVLINEPTYYFKKNGYAVGAGENSSFKVHVFIDNAVNLLVNSKYHIVYGKVDVRENGVLEASHTHDTQNILTGQNLNFPAPARVLDPRSGQILTRTTPHTMSTTTYERMVENQGDYNSFIPLGSSSCINGSSSLQTYMYTHSIYKKIRSRVHEVQSIQDNVSTSVAYTYANTNTVQPTKVTQTYPSGKKYITEYLYPDTYNDAVLQELVTQNRILPIRTNHMLEENGAQTVLGAIEVVYGKYTANSTSGGYSSNSSAAGPYLKQVFHDEVTWDPNGTYNLTNMVLKKTYNRYNTQVGKPSTITAYGWEPLVLTYDGFGNVLSTTYANHSKMYVYGPTSRLLLQEIDIDGTSTTYTHDEALRLKTITDNQRGVTQSFVYNFGTPTTGGNFIKRRTTFPAVTGSALSTIEHYDYYDGLGRPLVHREVAQGSTTGYDVYTMERYDARGRKVREYFPFELSTGTGFINPYASAYDSRAHELLGYDDSDRTISSRSYADHTTQYSYGTNTSGEVNGYVANTLYKVTVTDPEGEVIHRYRDHHGDLILERKEGGQGNHDTYLYYDAKHRPIEIVPPGSTQGNTILNTKYTYTGDDLVSSKSEPDKGMTQYWYDVRRQLSHVQDPNLQNAGRYLATRYDMYGRPTHTAFKNDLSALAAVSIDAIPTTDDYLSCTVYGSVGIERGKVKDAYLRMILPDGTLGKGEKRVYSYDPMGRMASYTETMTKEDGSVYSSSYQQTYDRGDHLLTSEQMTSYGGMNHTVRQRMIIDAAGREEVKYVSLDDMPEQEVAHMTYNARQQVSTLRYGGMQDPYSALAYHYRSDGLLRAINSPYASASTTTPIVPSDSSTASSLSDVPSPYIYHLDLEYRKDNNIKQVTSQVLDGNRRIYDLTYDGYDRLQGASYHEKQYNQSTVHSGLYDTQYSYDKRGNILTLYRKGMHTGITGVVNGSQGEMISGVLDHLSYSYTTGNQISQINDGGSAAGVSTVGNGSAVTYDHNGNMTYLPHQKATIAYSYLNLPRLISKSGGDGSSEWYYLADGRLKTRKTTFLGVDMGEKDYIGGNEYIGGILVQVNHDYGRITREKNCLMPNEVRGRIPSGVHHYYGSSITISGIVDSEADVTLHTTTGLAAVYEGLKNAGSLKVTPQGCPETAAVYEYAIRDHLGNTRLMVRDTNGDGSISEDEIMSEYHYYPYGMEQTGDWQNKPRRDYKYRYNGKEVVNDLGLRLYLFDTRYYDPALIDFLSVDKASDMFPSHSPYNYAHNNPVRYRDYLGMGPDDWFEDDKGNVHYDASITSQAEFDASGIEGTYLGKQGYGIDPNSGERISYNTDGSQTRSSNGLGEVTITASRGGYGKDIVSNAPNALEGASKGLLPYSNKGMILGEAMDLGLSGQLTTNKVNSLSTLHSLSKYSKRLGRLGSGGTYFFGGIDVGTNLIRERGFGTYTQQATGRFVGGWAGATYGAQLGAAYGTAVGPWGTLIGGVAGGIIGGFGGSYFGEKGVQGTQYLLKQ